MLDHLHILLNYQWDSKALLSIVLIGLPELEDRLARRHQRSLSSRLHTRLRIDPLVPADTAEYLRLARAGYEKGALHHRRHRHAPRGRLRRPPRHRPRRYRLPPRAARRKKMLVERDILARVLDSEAGREVA